MRIAYLATGFNVDERYGVALKLARQIRCWQELGHRAALFVQAHKLPDDHGRELFAETDAHFFADGPVAGRSPVSGLRRRLRTLSAVEDAVREWEPDLVYVRYNVWYPALERLASRYPVVLEINTDDIGEYRLTQPSYGYAYHRLTRSRLLSRAQGFVFVSGELALSPSYRAFRRPGVVIGNGVELRSFSPAATSESGSRPRLVFLGSPGHPWHGVDKILQMASLHPGWDFDVIGCAASDVGPSAPKNVTFHGYLPRSAYGRIFETADVAIGSLALHRNGMNEASPLKVREYLAYGLPVIIGYRDTDLSSDLPYVLQIPNSPDNVSTASDAIAEFVRRIRGTRVPRSAIAHLDTNTKEAARLAFFEDVTGSRTSTRSTGGRAELDQAAGR